MKPPEALIRASWPWKILGSELPEAAVSRAWTEEEGAAALLLLRVLCRGYESGWPDPSGCHKKSDREKRAMLAFDLGATPTYLDLADPERFRARVDVSPPLSLEEAEALAARRTPSEVRATTSQIVDWLGKTPRESEVAPAIFDLTRQCWMKVGVWLQRDLIATVGWIYREECFPFYSEILASPAASDLLKRHVNYIGDLIQNPLRKEDFLIRDDDTE